MGSFGYGILWLITLSLLNAGLHRTEANIVIGSVGETIQLNCLNRTVYSWQYGQNEFLALCENGNPRINTKLNISNRINISDACNTFTINDLKREDIGSYSCYFVDHTRHEIYIKLRSIKIIEAENANVITRKEGDTVILTCKVDGAMEDEKLFWIKENIIQSSKETSDCLVLQFVAHRSDYMKEFICLANNSVNTRPLTANVRLDLILKPRVRIRLSCNPIIMKGQSIKLTCLDDDEKIDIFQWTHNGSPLPTSTNTLSFKNASKAISGEYICNAQNAAGMDFDSVNITVHYPPVVQNQTVILNASDRPRSLECNGAGLPDVYNFSKWHHYTYNYDLVRSLDGSTNGTLILQSNVSMDTFYEDSGIYSCNITNGVPDESGNLWHSGIFTVKIDGPPVLAKPQKGIYIGHFKTSSILSLFILSYSKVSTSIWFSEIKERLDSVPCNLSVDVALFYGIYVNVSGYRCTFQIINTTKEDFQNYTVDIENKREKTTFEISLLSAGEPEKPTDIVLYSSSTFINLEWKSGFDGGSHQSFIIQYRQKSSSDWENLRAEHFKNSKQTARIPNLEPNTNYEVRLYACNKLGNSSVTQSKTITTKEKSNEDESYWTEFLLVLAIILPVCLFSTWWCLRKAKKSLHTDSLRANEERYQVEDGAIANNLNQSPNELIGQPSAVRDRPDDVYSSIDSRKDIVHEQNVTYKISKKCNKMKKSDQSKNKATHQRIINNDLDHPNLNYIEVVFDNATHNRAFYIHGADARTPYADIDFSATADPLDSSDENEECVSSGSVGNDDFVSVEEVQQ